MPGRPVIPLFGQDFRDDQYMHRRDVLEARLLSVALDVLTAGADVILDFGCWTKSERTALRYLVACAGAECELVYVTVPPGEQSRLVAARWGDAPHTTFPITDGDLAEWAADRWPSFRP